MLPLIYKRKLTFFLFLITICVLFGFSEPVLQKPYKEESVADSSARSNRGTRELKPIIDDVEGMKDSYVKRLNDVLKEFDNVLTSSVDYDDANNSKYCTEIGKHTGIKT